MLRTKKAEKQVYDKLSNKIFCFSPYSADNVETYFSKYNSTYCHSKYTKYAKEKQGYLSDYFYFMKNSVVSQTFSYYKHFISVYSVVKLTIWKGLFSSIFPFVN